MQISIKYITPVTYVTHSMGYSVAPEQSHSMIPSTEIYYGQSSLAEANRPNHIVQLLWMAQTMAITLESEYTFVRIYEMASRSVM